MAHISLVALSPPVLLLGQPRKLCPARLSPPEGMPDLTAVPTVPCTRRPAAARPRPFGRRPQEAVFEEGPCRLLLRGRLARRPGLAVRWRETPVTVRTLASSSPSPPRPSASPPELMRCPSGVCASGAPPAVRLRRLSGDPARDRCFRPSVSRRPAIMRGMAGGLLCAGSRAHPPVVRVVPGRLLRGVQGARWWGLGLPIRRRWLLRNKTAGAPAPKEPARRSRLHLTATLH